MLRSPSHYPGLAVAVRAPTGFRYLIFLPAITSLNYPRRSVAEFVVKLGQAQRFVEYGFVANKNEYH